jgi:glycosyltransferase involved in cell wall biosynthesis
VQRDLRISVVTPSFNQARYLEQTIRSVLEQEYEPLEYIVIDGGSRDQSVEIIRKHADRLAYWCSEPDKGQADAIQKGFKRATGDILCWLNSDDILLPGALRAVGDYFLMNPDIESVSAGAFTIDENGKPLRHGFGSLTLGINASYNRLRFYGQDGIFQPATFWRRSAYEAVGGVNPDFHFIMDLDLFARLAARRNFGRLPQFVAAFRLHAESKSMTIQKIRTAEIEQFDRIYGVAGLPGIWRKTLYWAFRSPALVRKLCLTLRYGLRLKSASSAESFLSA